MLTIEIDQDPDYGEWETVTVKDGDEIIAEVTTVADCPEDNTCSRLGLDSFARKIIDHFKEAEEKAWKYDELSQ